MDPTKKPRVTELKAVEELEQPLENTLKKAETKLETIKGDKLIAKSRPDNRTNLRLVLLACLLLQPITPSRATNGQTPTAMSAAAAAPPAAAPPEAAPPATSPTPLAQPERDRWKRSSLALKRPKPGSIGPGPREVWCLLPPRQHSSPVCVTTSGPDEQSNPGPEMCWPPPSLSPLLLFLTMLPTLEEAAAYFEEALGETPVFEGQERLRFERLLVFVWGNSWRRCVLSGGTRAAPGVTLDWWTNDDFGLSELREFFEAPFFRRCESERFYQWLADGGAHEADFRGHRLRMTVRKRHNVLFVQIQWWRSAQGAESSEAPLPLDVPLQASHQPKPAPKP